MQHAVVAGAGIGGLTASLVLSRFVPHVTLVERSEHPNEVGAALALQANGLAVLDRLGLLAAVRASASPIRRMVVRNGQGAIVMAAPAPDLGDGLQHALVVHRRDIHRLLLEAATSQPQISTRFGCTVTAADPDGSVHLETSAGAAQSLSADLVVGADGVSSRIRATGGFRSQTSTGTRYVRAIGRAESGDSFEEYWTRLGSFGHAPLGSGLGYFWAAAQSPAAVAAVAARDLEALAGVWRPVLPLAADLLSAVGSFEGLLVNTVRRVDCPRWFSGRLVLTGDAAHAMAPNLGQGANAAMVDAVVLGEALASGRSVAEGLAAYDRERRPVVRRIQNGAGLLQRLCGLAAPPATAVRDAILGLASRPQRLTSAGIRRSLLPDVRAVRAATVLD